MCENHTKKMFYCVLAHIFLLFFFLLLLSSFHIKSLYHVWECTKKLKSHRRWRTVAAYQSFWIHFKWVCVFHSVHRKLTFAKKNIIKCVSVLFECGCVCLCCVCMRKNRKCQSKIRKIRMKKKKKFRYACLHKEINVGLSWFLCQISHF